MGDSKYMSDNFCFTEKYVYFSILCNTFYVKFLFRIKDILKVNIFWKEIDAFILEKDTIFLDKTDIKVV